MAGSARRTYLVAAMVSAALVAAVFCVHRPTKSPNAYDYFVAAGKSLVRVSDIGEAVHGFREDGKRPRSYSVAEKSAIVRENRKALAKLRQGLRYDYRQPFRYGDEALFPEYILYRRLSFLLVLESEVRAAKGDRAGAVSSCQDGLMLGELIRRYDANMPVVGTGCQNVVRPGIWDCVPHLSSSQASAAAARMREIEKRHFAVQETLRCEKAAQLLWLRESFSGRYQSEFTKEFPRLPDYIKTMTLRRYTAYMDECIRKVQLPYASRPVFPEIKPNKNRQTAFKNLPADAILSIVCRPTQRYWLLDLNCQTRNRLLRVALVLQAYHVDHSGYPARLKALVPDYLDRVPVDLFAIGGLLRYHKHGSTYVLWSVGPDGLDDNGRPAVNRRARPDAPPEQRFLIDVDSKGDIVAGTHR